MTEEEQKFWDTVYIFALEHLRPVASYTIGEIMAAAASSANDAVTLRRKSQQEMAEPK